MADVVNAGGGFVSEIAPFLSEEEQGLLEVPSSEPKVEDSELDAEEVEETEEEVDSENVESAEAEEDASDEDAEDDPDEDEDDEPRQDPEEVPRAIRKQQKRIDKLTARAKSAEERAAQLEAQLAQAATPRVQPTEQEPLADVSSLEELEQRTARARELYEWTRLHPDGWEVPAQTENEEPRFVTPEEARRLEVQMFRLLNAAPKRQSLLQAQAQNAQEMRALAPVFYDPKRPEAKVLAKVKSLLPELSRFPDSEEVAVAYLLGRELLLQARQKGKEPTLPKGLRKIDAKRIAPPVANPPAMGRAVSGGAKELERAMKVMEESNGDPEATAAYFQALERSKAAKRR